MFYAWIMSIVGIVALGVLLDIILPEGEMSKYVKGIFSILVVLVIVNPLPSLLHQNFNKKDFLQVDQQIVTDNNFLEEVKEDKRKQDSEKLYKILLENGYNSVEVSIILEYGNKYKIDYVNVYIKNVEDNMRLIKLVSGALKISDAQVKIYER